MLQLNRRGNHPHHPRDILDFPDIADDIVVIASWNGVKWPDGRRYVSFLTEQRDAFMKGFIWNCHCINGLQFESKLAAFDWMIDQEIDVRPEHRVIMTNAKVITIGELKDLVGYPAGAYSRVIPA